MDTDPLVDLRYGNNLSNLCRRLAIESATHHPLALPGYAWHKFLAPIRMDSGGVFAEYTFHDKQIFSLMGNPEIIEALGTSLVGSPLATEEQVRRFVTGNYPLQKVEWFNALEEHWLSAVDCLHLPDSRYSARYTLPGLPIYHLLATLGACVALFRPGGVRRFHRGFVPVMFGTWFVVMLTAAVIPRHRFVWEPFWILYGFFLLDSVIAMLAALMQRIGRRTAPLPPVATPVMT